MGWMLISLLIMLSGTSVWAQRKAVPYKPPSIIHWAAGDVGAYMFINPATIAEKISPVLNSKIRLIPGNDMERLYMIKSGRAHLASMSADNYWGTMGLGTYSTFALGPQPLRLIWCGWPDYAGSTGIATKTSGIKTPYDLKGKRVAMVIGAAWSSEGIRGGLAFGNLSLADVTVVQVSSTGAAGKALIEGKADFTYLGSNTPAVYEMDSSPFGVNIVRYPHEDKEAWARYRNFMPYHMPGYSTVGPGIKPGEKIETPVYPYPMVTALASQSVDFVYAIAKAMHSKINEIAAAYPGNEAMKTERIRPEAMVMAPFHPGSIKLFKEIGLWTEAHEAAQKKILDHLEKVNNRWAAYVEDAQERMEKTKKPVNVEKEWREIVEKEVGLSPF